MRPRSPIAAIGLPVLCCLQAVIAALAAVSGCLSSVKARLWLAIWPKQCTDNFVLDRREVGMGRSGRIVVWAKATVPISALRVTIREGGDYSVYRLEDSPHYRWINALVNGMDSELEGAAYREYIRASEPDLDVDGHMRRIRRLVKRVSHTLARDASRVSLVVSCPEFSIRRGVAFHILDGNHRASIALALGGKGIQVMFAERR